VRGSLLRAANKLSFFYVVHLAYMEVQDTSAAIYSEAKSEYTKQLVFNFQPVLLRFFLDRFAEAKASPLVTSKAKSALSEFQDSLSQIPEWNIDKVQRETGGLLASIHCDYVEDLITAVFIAHTKILSAIRLHAKPRRKINITVPKPEHFMHRALSECSRLLWSNVYLFSDMGSSLDRQKNTTEMNRFLEEGLLQAIRNLLPVKSILRDSLQEDDDDGIEINSDVKPAVDTSGIEVANTPKADEVPEVSEVPEVPEVPEAPKVDETPKAETLPTIDLSVNTDPNSSMTMTSPTAVVATLTVPTISPTASLPDFPAALSGTSSPNSTLHVETERSVAFTGMDSVFGDGGHAELRPMIEEGDDEFKILGESEDIAMDEFEDLDAPAQVPMPLAADEYESI